MQYRITLWKLLRRARLSYFFPERKILSIRYGASHLDEEKMKTAFLRDEMTIESQQSLYFVPVRLG